MFDKLKNLFRKVGASMDIATTLTNITDDPRVEIPYSEVDRINKNLKYYSGSYDPIYYNVPKKRNVPYMR